MPARKISYMNYEDFICARVEQAQLCCLVQNA